ncbi:MAG TPA: flagellar motor switch protein FliG [Acidimicrobiales bacterium]|nr:flagellar motor switch protein FliG [Acidimicrobiales bacterium]
MSQVAGDQRPAASPEPPAAAGTARLDQLSGRQRVAIVLAQLPTAHSAAILRALGDEEAIALTTEIASLPPLDEAVVAQVVREFVQRLQATRSVGQGGLDRARALLTELVGAQRAEAVLAQLRGKDAVGPLAFLSHADPAHVVPFLLDEHPQTIAVVLAHLPAADAARILNALPAHFRNEVVLRIARMDRVPPEAISQAAGQLASKLRGLISAGSSVPGGIPSLVEILNCADASTEKQVLGDLEARDPELAEAVRARMFTFEDVLRLDDRTLQLVFRSVTIGDLALAVKGAGDDPQVRERIRSNLSERAAAELDEELEVLGPVRLSMVDAAQASIVRVVRELEADGTIVIARPTDEVIA